MPRYTSGYFLEIFLEGNVVNQKGEVDEFKKEIIEQLRKLEKEFSEIEVWPKIGVPNLIRITGRDSLPLANWEKVKEWVKGIIEGRAR